MLLLLLPPSLLPTLVDNPGQELFQQEIGDGPLVSQGPLEVAKVGTIVIVGGVVAVIVVIVVIDELVQVGLGESIVGSVRSVVAKIHITLTTVLFVVVPVVPKAAIAIAAIAVLVVVFLIVLLQSLV